MAIRVAQIGTGNVGVHALKALITNPEYEGFKYDVMPMRI